VSLHPRFAWPLPTTPRERQFLSKKVLEKCFLFFCDVITSSLAGILFTVKAMAAQVLFVSRSISFCLTYNDVDDDDDDED
jgi:hypothetical protein